MTKMSINRRKFKKEGVDGLMLPHCNFGTEYVCARLAKKLDVPVLLWGPLDERPEPNGVRLRDTQCGLFATGKVLRRFQIPFTYLTNCRLNDPVFERGVKDFLAVCNVVKHLKISGFFRFQHVRLTSGRQCAMKENCSKNLIFSWRRFR